MRRTQRRLGASTAASGGAAPAVRGELALIAPASTRVQACRPLIASSIANEAISITTAIAVAPA